MEMVGVEMVVVVANEARARSVLNASKFFQQRLLGAEYGPSLAAKTASSRRDGSMDLLVGVKEVIIPISGENGMQWELEMHMFLAVKCQDQISLPRTRYSNKNPSHNSAALALVMLLLKHL